MSTYGAPPTWGGTSGVQGWGPPGRVRSTGVSILLFLVTFGLYSWYWFYVVHDELKRHRGTGLGGGVALIIAVLAGVASPFLTSHEVGEAQEQSGQRRTVSWTTGLWVVPGALLLVLPLVWFVKTNGALNEHWRRHGAVG